MRTLHRYDPYLASAYRSVSVVNLSCLPNVCWGSVECVKVDLSLKHRSSRESSRDGGTVGLDLLDHQTNTSLT